MSANYLLLKENNTQEALSQSSSMNQTIIHKDANASFTLVTPKTLEWNVSDVLIITAILFSISVLLKLIEKLFAYFGKKIHTYFFKTDSACDEAKESSRFSSSNTQSIADGTKDFQ